MSSLVQSQRARVAALTKNREPGDPAIAEARRELQVANLAAHIARVVDAAPPALTPKQQQLLLSALLPAS